MFITQDLEFADGLFAKGVLFFCIAAALKNAATGKAVWIHCAFSIHAIGADVCGHCFYIWAKMMLKILQLRRGDIELVPK